MFSTATWSGLAALLGLIIGSFLNVVILRLPRRMEAQWRQEAQRCLELPVDQELPPGIVRQSSHCPDCQHRLGILDNIPLLSWITLRGHCRYCHGSISVQYPLIEAAAACIGALTILALGPTAAGLAGLGLSWSLLTLTAIDIRTQLLPDVITLPLLWAGLLLSLYPLGPTPADAILGAGIGYLSLWSVYWLFRLLTGKHGMGHGDFKLLAALGAWLGPSALLPIILLSSLVGTLVGLGLLCTGRHRRATPMAFGPFLAAAGWLWLVAGHPIEAAWLSEFSR